MWDGTSKEVKINGAVAALPPLSAHYLEDLAAHEWGHAFMDHAGLTTGGTAHEKDPQAFGEGFADCVSANVYPTDWQFGLAGDPDYRDLKWASTAGGYRNVSDRYASPHDSGRVLGNVCFLSGYSRVAPTTACTKDADCQDPTGAPFSGVTKVCDTGSGTCYVISQKTAVPYVGHTAAMEGIMRLFFVERPAVINGTSTWANMLELLAAGGCQADEDKGDPACAVRGISLYSAAYAAGLWDTPRDSKTDGATTAFQTSSRPAPIADINTAGAFGVVYRKDGTNDLYEAFTAGGPDSDYSATAQVKKGSTALQCGSGLSGVRGPVMTPAREVAVICKDPAASQGKLYAGNRTATYVSWDQDQTLAWVNTDGTPAAVNAFGKTYIFWKASGTSKDLRWGNLTGGTGAVLVAGATDHAPSAIYANDYIWVFWASANVVGGCRDLGWAAVDASGLVSQGNVGACLDSAPDAAYYVAPFGDVSTSYAWVFGHYPDRTSSPGVPAGLQLEGTRGFMLQLDVTGTPAVTAKASATDLFMTGVKAAVPIFHAAVPWDERLCLFFPRDGTKSLGQFCKQGEG